MDVNTMCQISVGVGGKLKTLKLLGSVSFPAGKDKFFNKDIPDKNSTT
jgi:hypothetical protein